MTLDQAIKCLMQLEQAAMHLAEAKTSNQDFSQEDLKTIQQSIEQLKPFFNDKSPAQTILNDPKFQFSTDSNGNLIAMETSNLGMSMKKQIGILNE